MYTHGQKILPPKTVDLVKFTILSPSIAEEADGKSTMADHSYDRLLRLVDASNWIDDTFARRFADQLVFACRTSGSRRRGPPKVLCGALDTIIQRAPAAVWPVLASFYEIATRVERDRMTVRIVSDRLAHSAKDAGKAVCFAVIAATFHAGDDQAQAVRAKSAKCSWWFFVMNDRRFVMRPAPSVVGAILIFEGSLPRSAAFPPQVSDDGDRRQ